jgi:hypothetical protein
MAKSGVDAAEIAQRGLQLPSYDDAAVAAGLVELRQLMAERDSRGWSDAEAEWFLKDRSLEVEEAADKLARYARAVARRRLQQPVAGRRCHRRGGCHRQGVPA